MSSSKRPASATPHKFMLPSSTLLNGCHSEGTRAPVLLPAIARAALALFIVRRCRLLQHQLPVADRNAITRVVIHFNGSFLITESISHRIADLLLRLIVDRCTPRFRGRVSVVVLHVLLESITAVAARGRAGDRRHIASA